MWLLMSGPICVCNREIVERRHYLLVREVAEVLTSFAADQCNSSGKSRVPHNLLLWQTVLADCRDSLSWEWSAA